MYRVFACFVVAVFLCLSVCGFATAWPDRTVRLIVPVPAGSAADFTARLFAERLSSLWAQPVTVENRPGADGVIGVSSFISLHDDHALLFAISAIATVHAVQTEKLPYDPINDLVPISPASEIVLAIATSEQSSMQSLQDVIQRARAAPAKLNWASSPGLPPYVFGAFFKGSGLEITSIFYRDLAPALQDLGQGRLDLFVHALSVLIPQAQANRARLLAVASPRRAAATPEVPSVAELGFAELTMEGLCGFFGARGMSVATRAQIAADVMTVANEPAVRQRLAAIGQTVHPATPAEFAAFLADKRERLIVLARTAGMPTRQR
jgi:tripartite-type tricarboxylate transporter receptor subunit TctC